MFICVVLMLPEGKHIETRLEQLNIKDQSLVSLPSPRQRNHDNFKQKSQG